MTAFDQTVALPKPLPDGAVHIWTLAFAREALNMVCREQPPRFLIGSPPVLPTRRV